MACVSLKYIAICITFVISYQHREHFHSCISHASLMKSFSNSIYRKSHLKTETLFHYGEQHEGMKANGFFKTSLFFFYHVLHSHIYLYLRALASMKPESFSNYKINSNSNIHHSISIPREQSWLDRLAPLHSRVRLMSV